MSNLIKDAAAFLRDDQRRRNWAKVVQVMACVVVFVTTYALILPAITLENYTCGLAEHEHGLDCYQQITSVSEKQLSCGAEDIVDEETGEIIEVHTHSEECYTTIDVPVDFSVLTCGKADSAEHFHNDLCYGKWKLDCDKTVHIHDESCQPVSSANETEAAISTEAVTIPSEAETIATDSTTAPTESTEEATTSTEAATESTEETTEATEETTVPTEETVPEILEQVYSDDDVIVTVTYGPEAGIPEGAQLVVDTYTESYEEYYAQAQELLADEKTEDGENLEIAEFYLYDIHFLFEDQIIQPNEAVTVTIQFVNGENVTEGTPVSVIHFAEEGAEVLENTAVDENGSTTFLSDSFSPYGISVMSLAREASYEDTLLAHFSFDNETDGFTYNNVSATKIDNAAIAPDSVRGSVLSLDGDGDYLDITTGLLNGYDSITVAYWSKPSSATGKNWSFFAAPNDDGQTNGSETYLAFLEGNPYMQEQYLNGRNNPPSASITGSAATTNWHYVTLVFSSNRMEFYIDGSSVAESTTAEGSFHASLSEILSTDNILQIGKANYIIQTEPEVIGEYYAGLIDEFRVYGSALTDDQISSLFEEEKNTPVVPETPPQEESRNIDDSLIAYFSFDNDTTGLLYNGVNGNAVATLKDGAALSIIDDDGNNPAYNGNALDLTAADTGAFADVTTGLLKDCESITVSYWSKPTVSTAKNWTFFAAPDTTSSRDLYLGILESGNYTLEKFYNGRGNGNNWQFVSNRNVPNSTTWEYVTAVFEETQLTLYINGELVETRALTGTPGTIPDILGPTNILQIGKANWTDSGEFYKGYIDEFRIYATDLTAEEVKQLHAAEVRAKEEADQSYEDTLIAYFSFDNDTTGLHYNGSNGTAVADLKDGAKLSSAGVDGVNHAYKGNALDLSNVDGFANVTKADGTSLLTGLEEITVSYWSMLNNAEADNWSFFAASNTTPKEYLGVLEGGHVYDTHRFEYNGPGTFIQSGPNPAVNEWCHIAIVISKEDVRLYLDDQQIAQHIFVEGENYNLADILRDDSILEIGRNLNYDEYFDGYIDEYRIYSSALTDAEVRELYNKEKQDKVPYQDTLLAHFTFNDEATGFTSSTGTGAVASGSTSIKEGYSDDAFYLTGDDFLTVTKTDGSSLLTGHDEITVSYWSKPANANNTNWGFFAANGYYQAGEDQHYLGILENGDFKAQQLNGGDTHIAGGDVVAGVWHYVTAVYSSAGLQLYVDGKSVAHSETVFPDPSAILGDNSILQIGKANYGNGEFYRGYIDEYSIYGSALTAAEVAELYNSQPEKNEPPYEDSLIAYFPFGTASNDGTDGFTYVKNGTEMAIATSAESIKGHYNEDAFYLTGDSFLKVTKPDGSSLLTGCEEITVSFWSNPSKANATNWGFFAAPDESAQLGNENYLGFLENGNYKAEQFQNADRSSVISGGSVTANTWHYVTVVYSETGARMYVNGTQINATSTAQFPNPADILGENSILQIGKANYGTGEYYTGYIDEYRIYNTALSDADILDLYTKEVKKENTLTSKTAVPIDFSQIGTLDTAQQYVLYTEYKGKYYAITSKSGDIRSGYIIPLTKNNDGTFSWSGDDSNNIFWTIEANTENTSGGYFVRNVGSEKYLHAFDNSNEDNPTNYGPTTVGKNPSQLTSMDDGSFVAKGNGTNYVGLVDAEVNEDNNILLKLFERVQGEGNAAKFWLATVADTYHNVWLDGTNGDIMAYADSPDQHYFVVGDTFILPTTWPSPTKYGYTLRGWYDITHGTYYAPGETYPRPVSDETGEAGETVTEFQDAVFYADWAVLNYNFGQVDTRGTETPNNPHDDAMSKTVDTKDFVRISVFDYNDLFNVQSTKLKNSSISETSHDETWELVQSGTVPYEGMNTLNFLFRDWDSQFIDITYPANVPGTRNDNVSSENREYTITSGIVGPLGSAAPDLLTKTLFGNDSVIGKTRVGSANHLFQYVDPDDPLYASSENAGYYYYDSKYNAASYNQEQQRFYVYNYRERTTDSEGGGNLSSYSDFLPFNSPYLYPADKDVLKYSIPSTTYFQDEHYQYDAKYGIDNGSHPDHVIANYNFGMKLEIDFFLPNNCGETDAYGNLGNLSAAGLPMEFGFEGDDDLWVYVDGKLMLDVGGIHGVQTGSINFSTGTVTSDEIPNGISFTKILNGSNISEGSHTMTIYYLERGSSQSNCAIYFNLTPRYGMDLTKVDYHDHTKLLPGATFNVYTDPKCTQQADLWYEPSPSESVETADTRNEDFTGFTTDENGKLSFWGLVTGKAYYIKEVAAPANYEKTEDVIRVSLSNRGLTACDVTVLRADDSSTNGNPSARSQSSGFEVLSTVVDQENLSVHMVLTNPSTQSGNKAVLVQKVWAEGSTRNPPPITVHLQKNGADYMSAELNEDNGWVHMWERLDDNATYTVTEDVPGGYVAAIQQINLGNTPLTNWSHVAFLEDRASYRLTYTNPLDQSVYVLTVDENGRLTWISEENARDNDLWISEVEGMGFRLQCGEYYLTLTTSHQFTASKTLDGNQTIYYDGNGGLYALSDNVHYVVGYSDGSVTTSTDNSYVSLMRKDTVSTDVIYYRITNAPSYELPETGGSGTVLYTVSGLALLAAAAFLELNRRRRYV